ncbi:MAG: AAA family ATPase, partial [Cyanobacteria bacterium]|nr:AAA family ATPase [Cyanobacteriota bacterium]
MADKVCQMCGVRTATMQVRISRDGRTENMMLCNHDYNRLQTASRRSPFESLFGSDLFGHFLQPSDHGALSDRIERQKPERSINIVDRFSEQAKEILQQAAAKSGELNKKEVDTEHALYVLADNEMVQSILNQFKLSTSDLKGYLDANCFTLGSEKWEGEIEISPRMKGALQLAFAAAQDLGHSYVGPEHILIGLAEEEDGLAGQVLRKYGLTPQALRQKTVKVVGQGAQEGRVEEPSTTPQLDKFSRDLTSLANKGRLDPVIGRAQEIETVIEVLARRKKNNPVLIGEPGVGKTAIVEGLAQRIISGDVPEVLRDKRLVELNVNSMVAGSKYRGEFEERVKNVLDEIVANADRMVVFIDEIHTIVGAGQGGEGGLDIANTFKPALARGELHLVGATTLNEYQKHIEKDAALERRFQPVFISEPTVEQTISILRGLRDHFEAHHKVVITDEAMVAAAELSDRYITNRFLPDKAIDLIDQAAARMRISMTSRPVEIQELDAQTKQLKREQDYA